MTAKELIKRSLKLWYKHLKDSGELLHYLQKESHEDAKNVPKHKFSGHGSLLLDVDPDVQEFLMTMFSKDVDSLAPQLRMNLNYAWATCIYIMRTWCQYRERNGKMYSAMYFLQAIWVL